MIVNYLSSDIAGAREAGRITDLWLTTENALRIGKLISLIHSGMLSSRGAKDTLALMFSSPEDPETLAREHDLIQKSDTAALEAIVQKVIASQSEAVGEYRAGKTAALQFLVGQGMKESKGSANPALLRSIFERLLS